MRRRIQNTSTSTALVCSGAPAYPPGVIDAPMLPQRGRMVLVMLRDGRQLEGELIVLTDRFQVSGVLFEQWEIGELCDESAGCLGVWW
jgi:hypothetical protein